MSKYLPSLLHRQQHGAVAIEDAVAQPLDLANTDAGQQRRHGRRWRGLAAVALCAAVVGVAYARQPTMIQQSVVSGDASLIDIAISTAPTPPAQTWLAQPFPKVVLPPPATTTAEEIPPLSFEALNYYHVRDGKPASDYPWLKNVKLVEPHRHTTFSVSSPRDGYEYVWEIRGGDPEKDDLRARASGAETDLVLTILDDNMVTLKEVNSDGEVVWQLDEIVMVKYVRREIRTLTDDEREELLDAVRASKLRVASFARIGAESVDCTQQCSRSTGLWYALKHVGSFSNPRLHVRDI